MNVVVEPSQSRSLGFSPASTMHSLATALYWFVVSRVPQSRQHEHEADELGLQLVARTCRDPKKAATAHQRLMELEQSQGGDTSKTSIFSSHPATQERLEKLEAQVPEARKLYDACGCSARKRIILRTLGLESGS